MALTVRKTAIAYKNDNFFVNIWGGVGMDSISDFKYKLKSIFQHSEGSLSGF
jgi:hypothetical protein